MRLISFGFDSFKSKIGGDLISALRFGYEVCVWFLKKYKKIWVLSFGFGDQKSGFDCLKLWWCGGLKYGFEFNF